MQVRVGTLVLLTALVGWLAAAPEGAAQYYPPQGYGPTDPYAQYTQPYGQGAGYGQYYTYGYGQYPTGQPGASAVYGYGGYPTYGGYAGYGGYPGYGGYGYGSPGYGYGSPYAYQGYGSPYAPPGYGYAYAPYQQQNSYPGYYSGYPGPAPYPPYPSARPYSGSGGAFTVTATPAGPTQATLTWTPVPGAVSYNVYQGVNGATLTFSSTTNGTTTTVPLGQGSYVFQIHAVGPSGFEVGVSNVTAPLSGGGGAPYYGGYPYPSYPGGYPYPGYPGGPPAPGAPGQPAPATSTVVVSPNPASVTTTAQLAVTVLDVNRTPIVGRTVYVTSSRPLIDVITPASSPVTDGSGRVFFNVRGTSPGQSSLTAAVDGIQLNPAFVTFNP